MKIEKMGPPGSLWGVMGGGVSLQSWGEVCREGDSGRKNSYGDSLPLVECAAGASFENTSASTGGFQCPLRKVFTLHPPGTLWRD